MAAIWIINGPNLDLLGQREPDLYGASNLVQILKTVQKRAKEQALECHAVQVNDEAQALEKIDAAVSDGCQCLILNPAALTHTSIALRDRLLAQALPFIEIHLSNIYQREPWRRHSYFSDIALGVMSGLGPHVYTLALDAAAAYLQHNSANT